MSSLKGVDEKHPEPSDEEDEEVSIMKVVTAEPQPDLDEDEQQQQQQLGEEEEIVGEQPQQEEEQEEEEQNKLNESKDEKEEKKLPKFYKTKTDFVKPSKATAPVWKFFLRHKTFADRVWCELCNTCIAAPSNTFMVGFSAPSVFLRSVASLNFPFFIGAPPLTQSQQLN
jgi:hypothetical protein